MWRISIIVFLTFPSASPGQDLGGSYAYRGSPCDVADFQVRIGPDRLSMGHVQCRFIDQVDVQDMPAELRRAACRVEDIPEMTRFLVAQDESGLVLYSPDLGTTFLDRCPR